MTTDIAARGYAHPERLVSTDWVEEHHDDPSHAEVKVIECDEDATVYDSGHVPGAIKVDWVYDLNDHLQRDYLDRAAFAARMGALGIHRSDTLVLYGDKNNWMASAALWVFTLFGHPDLRIMEGGRAKWLAEDRPMTSARRDVDPTTYEAPERDDRSNRVFRDAVLGHVEAGGRLIDVRSPDEFHGKRVNMPNSPNVGALRAGHIPGATNVVWVQAMNEDGTFRTADELQRVYEHGAGLSASDRIVTYCRTGERSSHTWFVLKYLLGYRDVRSYDGSWTEWGNLVGVPIEL